jgi:hypothetical protein
MEQKSLMTLNFLIQSRRKNSLPLSFLFLFLPTVICHCVRIHISTCTSHSGVKKTHDWTVDQISDLFRTTHKVKKQQMTGNRGQFYYRRDTKTAALRVNLTINLVSIFMCSSTPHNPVYVRRVDLSTLAFSLSSHRHSYRRLLFTSHFIGS